MMIHEYTLSILITHDRVVSLLLLKLWISEEATLLLNITLWIQRSLHVIWFEQPDSIRTPHTRDI